MFNRSDFARIETGIATRGGDFQETVSIGDRVYATCHCADFYFRGTRTFSTYPASYAEANRIMGYVMKMHNRVAGLLDSKTPLVMPVFILEPAWSHREWLTGFLMGSGVPSAAKGVSFSFA